MKIEDFFNGNENVFLVDSNSLGLALSYNNAHLIAKDAFIKNISFIKNKHLSKRKCKVNFNGIEKTMFISNKENKFSFSTDTLPSYYDSFDFYSTKFFYNKDEAYKYIEEKIKKRMR